MRSYWYPHPFMKPSAPRPWMHGIFEHLLPYQACALFREHEHAWGVATDYFQPDGIQGCSKRACEQALSNYDVTAAKGKLYFNKKCLNIPWKLCQRLPVEVFKKAIDAE